MKLNLQNILRNVRQPMLILVSKVWQRNLDYAKNLQANILLTKIFQSMIIPSDMYCHFVCLHVITWMLKLQFFIT